MTPLDSSLEPDAEPLQSIWQALLEGDPGPAVAFFDSLIASDFAYAAGGLLRDIAERIADLDTSLDDDLTSNRFRDAAKKMLESCLDGDLSAVADLMAETQED